MIAAIRERLEKATPGPWVWDGGDLVGEPEDRNGRIARAYGWPKSYGDRTERNAEFIAHAPADLAWCLDEIDRLRSQLDAMVKHFGELPRYTFCIREGCGDGDIGDIDQRTGLCGMCERSERLSVDPDALPWWKV